MKKFERRINGHQRSRGEGGDTKRDTQVDGKTNEYRMRF